MIAVWSGVLLVGPDGGRGSFREGCLTRVARPRIIQLVQKINQWVRFRKI